MLYLTNVNGWIVGYVILQNGCNVKVMSAQSISDVKSFVKNNYTGFQCRKPKGPLFVLKRVDKW